MKLRDVPALVIRGGRVIDPACGRDEISDVCIADGMICPAVRDDAEVFDAEGLIVSPGLMDIHVHLREPGGAHKETIETGTAAAARGGFTFVACMPNTRPPIDNPDAVRWVLETAKRSSRCTVGPIACITRERRGETVTDVGALLDAGAVAISDDGDGVEQDDVMRAALIAARSRNTVVIQHCEYKTISAGGVMHLGDVSRRLGVPGLDPKSEEAMIDRDIALCRETGGRYHVAHISTARAVDMVRRAKAEGVPVTSEVCTHHLLLTDEACSDLDPNTKMHPPLRPQSDVEACRRGLLDGTIDCIVTDHAPHAADEKDMGFLAAPPGIVGLETSLGLAAKAMIETGLADWPRFLEWFTAAPARVLGRTAPSLEQGRTADLTIIDPRGHWTVDPDRFAGKGRNTPFGGWSLPARAVATVRGTGLVVCHS